MTDRLRSLLHRRELLKKLLAGTSAALMSAPTVAAGHLTTAQSPESEWQRLESRIRGGLLQRGSVPYEESRRAMVWNALKPDRFPDAIVRVTSDSDVVEAVRFASRRKMKIAVRGSGHNWHNPTLRRGGLLLDLGGLNQMTVDPGLRRAAVQPCVTAATVMANLAPHNLAFPVGHSPTVPMSGFLLNGGLGWNYRNWGPSCASVEAIDMVDARGRLLRADQSQNADLFWAARGAGPGFFGVVTRFHLRLFALPPVMMSSTLRYAADDTDRVVAWLSQLVPFADAVEVNCSVFARSVQINAMAFSDTIANARQALSPLEAEPDGLIATRKNMYQPASVEAVFGRPTGAREAGPLYAGDSGWSEASPRELLSSVRGAMSGAPPGAVVQMVFLHNKTRPAVSDMSFSMSGSTYVHTHVIWKDAAEEATNVTWLRNTVEALEPHKHGHYVGEADLTIAPERVRQCFSPGAWNRLSALKKQYDPDDLFFSYLQETARPGVGVA